VFDYQGKEREKFVRVENRNSKEKMLLTILVTAAFAALIAFTVFSVYRLIYGSGVQEKSKLKT
jgi:hypothetical protein